MLVAELHGTIKVLPPPYTQADPDAVPPAHEHRTQRACSRGSTTSRSTRNFTTNHFYYVFYTLGSPNRDRLSRFTANAALHRHGRRQRARPLPGPAGRERRASRRRDHLRQRREALLHDRRPLRRPRDSQIADEPAREDPPDQPGRHGSDRQPVLRRHRPELRLDLGARPAEPVPRVLRRARPGGCSSATSAATTTRRRTRRIDLGVAGRELRLAELRDGTCGNPAYTAALYCYPHDGRDAAHHGRVRLPRHPVPEQLPGQLLLRRLRPELDQAPDVRRQRQRHRRLQLRAGRRLARRARTATSSYLDEGPDGALYYVDLGYSRHRPGTFGVSKIRRIRYISGNQAPIAAASANPTSGPAPLTVNFSSAGLLGSRGPAADLLVDVRRRHDLDRGQPDATRTRSRASTRRGSPSPTA